MAPSYRSLKADPVVFVVQDLPGKNMLGALDFGSMELLLQADEEPALFNIPQVTQKITQALRWMMPKDFLLLSGSPIAIAIAASVAARVTGGRYNVLKWDQQERRYWQAEVNLNLEE